MSSRRKHRAVIYARKSISDRTGDESGSITEQLESGRHYAASQGWEVVGEFVDDGVSAGNAPGDRAGWKAVLAADGYDRVIVRHLDRVSRSLYDFLTVDKVLQGRGAALVAVRQNLDMSSPNGRLFANILASFAEYERELIRERVAGTRQHNLRNGKVVGGALPFGWMSVYIDPDDPKRGKVLRRDPDRIDWVRGMVERCQRGESIYKITQWLNDEDAPLPTVAQQNRKNDGWRYNTVESLLRNPVLAGLTPFNPGGEGKKRGKGVLRDERGLPVVDEAVAIMTLSEWRAMVDGLDNRDSPQAKSRPERAVTSGLLSGMVFCGRGDKHGDEQPRMWRGTIQGRHGYYCRECHQSISTFEDDLIEHFLTQKGDWPRWSRVIEVYEGGATELPEIELRIKEELAALGDADEEDEADEINERLKVLRAERKRLRDLPGQMVDVWDEGDHYFSELWATAEDAEQQRAVLRDAIERIVVNKGSGGRRKAGAALSRLDIAWVRPDEVGPRPLEA